MTVTTTTETEAERLLSGPQLFLSLRQVGQLFGITYSAAAAAASRGQLFGLPIVQLNGPTGTRRVPTVAVRALYERVMAGAFDPHEAQEEESV